MAFRVVILKKKNFDESRKKGIIFDTIEKMLEKNKGEIVKHLKGSYIKKEDGTIETFYYCPECKKYIIGKPYPSSSVFDSLFLSLNCYDMFGKCEYCLSEIK